MQEVRSITCNSQTFQSHRVRLSLGLSGLLLAALLVRVVGVERPLLGHFATKNVVYAMIARNWASGVSSVWYPTLDCLAGGQRAWHLLEVPVAAYVAGAGWALLGGSLDVWGRATSILFSVASVAVMFLLVRRWHGGPAGWAAAVTLGLSPVSIIFGQSFMLESSVVFFALATLWCLDTWLLGRRLGWLVLAAGCFALLLLTKVFMLVLLLPMAAMVYRRARADGSFVSGWPLALVGATMLAAVVPAAAWYTMAYAVSGPDSSSAEHVYYSIRESAAVHRWPHPLLTSPDFYRQLLDSLVGPMLTPLALVLALAGFLDPAWRRHLPWLAAMALLVIALPLKFYKMPYYGLVVLPPLCVLSGLGWQLIYRRLQPGRMATGAVLILAVILSARWTMGPAFTTPREDRAVGPAAQALRELAGQEDLVVTMHGSTIDLLYYCDRRGWAISPEDKQISARLDEARRQGARWLVVANLNPVTASPPARTALAALPIVREGDDWRVYQLHEPATDTARVAAPPRRRGFVNP